MSDFENRVLPVVRRFAARFRDPEMRADIETEAYFVWAACSEREQVDAANFAWYGIRRLLGGRQEGMYAKRKDAFNHAWVCGLMGQATDRKMRRPEEIATIRELLLKLYRLATPAERRMIRHIRAEMLGTFDLAHRMQLSPGRISQLRRQLRDKLKGLS